MVELSDYNFRCKREINIVDGHRKNMLASVNAMDLKTEQSFSVQELMNGTESSQLLMNQWHSVAKTTISIREILKFE